jgi:hypothetical protein
VNHIVLQHFQNYGDILQHKSAPNGDSWLWVKFARPEQARAALAKNGKVIHSGKYIVGVAPASKIRSQLDYWVDQTPEVRPIGFNAPLQSRAQSELPFVRAQPAKAQSPPQLSMAHLQPSALPVMSAVTPTPTSQLSPSFLADNRKPFQERPVHQSPPSTRPILPSASSNDSIWTKATDYLFGW